MADNPVERPSGEDAQPKPSADEGGTEQAQGGLGWHEPTVDEGSSRPVDVSRWFAPETPAAADATPPSQPTPSQTERPQAPTPPPPDRPKPAPIDAGAWYTPAESALDTFFDQAEQTIVETHAEMPNIQVAAEQESVAEPATQAENQPVATAEAAPAPAPVDPQLLSSAITAEPASAVTEAEGGSNGHDAGDATSDGERTPIPEPTPAEPIKLGPRSEESTSEEGAAENPEPSPDAAPFEEVERKVQDLLERHNKGELTREQLQHALRGLMILDGQGRWWMLGLESQRWYYYDGKEWVAGTPPGYAERVQGSAVRTETGLQEVLAASAAGLTSDTATEGDQLPPLAPDDESAILPKHVPQFDPGATLVSPNTPFLEPVRSSEAPTYSNGPRVADGDGATDRTLPSQAFNPDVTMPGGALRPSGGEAARPAVSTLEAAAVSPAPARAGRRPKYTIGEFPQPDYSAALGPSRNRNTYAKWAIRFGVFGTLGGMALTLVVLLLMIAYYFYKVNQYAEAVGSLEQRAADFETTLILNANGDTLAEFNNPDTGARQEVPLDQISPWLIDATIATENETFYTDPGFSVLAIVRAAYQNLTEGATVSGASTITQQLARALVLETEFAAQRTTERKIVEVIVASEIKRKYSKNEILQIYLNEIFYGNFSYGIEAASQQYFRKPASELNPAEAAFLAGLPQAPAEYDPVVNREAALNRMRTVLRLMSEANGNGCVYIEHQDQTSWGVPQNGGACVMARPDASGGTVYYYQTPNMAEPQEMTLDIALVETAVFDPPKFETTHPHFVNYVWQQLEDTYGPQAIYSAGFRVYTTLDERIQQSAEQAVTKELQTLQARGTDATNASVVVMRPSDGAVLAMVGSADYNNEDIDGQVNIAFTAQQPGSSIKPLVYLAAFEPDNNQYYTPATVLWDVYSDFSGYVPTNYDMTYHGPQSVREALGNSLNVPAVKTLQFTGLLDFTEMAEAAGITWPLGNPIERQAGLPTALGAVEVRLFDMVQAYGMFANNGYRVDPYSIVYIEDSKGNEIYQVPTNKVGPQVVQPEYAYLVTSILSDNAARAAEFGRGWPMELGNGRPAAIKTGTSNDSRDVWTVGYTPQMAVGVWVGNSDNRPMYGLTGYYGAAPIWNEVMEAALADQPVQQFQQPPGVVQMEVCADTGAQPSAECAGRTYTEVFAASAPPPAAAQGIFRTVQVDEYTGKIANQYCTDDVVERTFIAISDASAVNWINNTPEGNTWASARNLQTPLQPLPSEECSANEPRPQVVLSFPQQDMTVEGVLPLRGTVRMPDFSRYEIRYGISHDPGAFSEPLTVDTTEKPDAESILGQFDTRTLENGPYTMRLVAIDQYGRRVTRDVRINVNNPEPTPAPIPTATIAPTLTPEAGPASFATPPAGEQPTNPTAAPSPTPTWTLTPTPGGQ